LFPPFCVRGTDWLVICLFPQLWQDCEGPRLGPTICQPLSQGQSESRLGEGCTVEGDHACWKVCNKIRAEGVFCWAPRREYFSYVSLYGQLGYYSHWDQNYRQKGLGRFWNTSDFTFQPSCGGDARVAGTWESVSCRSAGTLKPFKRGSGYSKAGKPSEAFSSNVLCAEDMVLHISLRYHRHYLNRA